MLGIFNIFACDPFILYFWDCQNFQKTVTNLWFYSIPQFPVMLIIIHFQTTLYKKVPVKPQMNIKKSSLCPKMFIFIMIWVCLFGIFVGSGVLKSTPTAKECISHTTIIITTTTKVKLSRVKVRALMRIKSEIIAKVIFKLCFGIIWESIERIFACW